MLHAQTRKISPKSPRFSHADGQSRQYDGAPRRLSRWWRRNPLCREQQSREQRRWRQRTRGGLSRQHKQQRRSWERLLHGLLYRLLLLHVQPATSLHHVGGGRCGGGGGGGRLRGPASPAPHVRRGCGCRGSPSSSPGHALGGRGGRGNVLPGPHSPRAPPGLAPPAPPPSPLGAARAHAGHRHRSEVSCKQFQLCSDLCSSIGISSAENWRPSRRDSSSAVSSLG